MLVQVLLYFSSVLVFFGLLDQFLFCWYGKGIVPRKVGDEPGAEEISVMRWVFAALANVLWIVYGVAKQDSSTPPVVIICGAYLVMDLGMVLALLRGPPERTLGEKRLLQTTLVASLVTVVGASLSTSFLFPMRNSLVWFPVVATLGLTSLGRIAQIRVLIRDRLRGKLTLWEGLTSAVDAIAWTLFGITQNAIEVWIPCCVAALLDIIRLWLFAKSR